MKNPKLKACRSQGAVKTTHNIPTSQFSVANRNAAAAAASAQAWGDDTMWGWKSG